MRWCCDARKRESSSFPKKLLKFTAMRQGCPTSPRYYHALARGLLHFGLSMSGLSAGIAHGEDLAVR